MSKVSKAFQMRKGEVRTAISTKNFFDAVIQAQGASAAPPLGPLLGKFGLNINNFCKIFNEKTKTYKPGIPLPVVVKIKPDRSYDILIETPSINYYLMQAAGITQPKLPDETKSGEITLKHCYEIAQIKNTDPNSKMQVYDLDELVQEVVNTASAIGLELVKEIDPEKYKVFLDERNAYLEQLAREQEEQEKLKFQRISLEKKA